MTARMTGVAATFAPALVAGLLASVQTASAQTATPQAAAPQTAAPQTAAQAADTLSISLPSPGSPTLPYHAAIRLLDPKDATQAGAVTLAEVDSGSVGLHLHLSRLPASLQKTGTLSAIRYSSDGLALIGRKVEAKVNLIPGTVNSATTTAPMPVNGVFCTCQTVSVKGDAPVTKDFLPNCQGYNGKSVPDLPSGYALKSCHAAPQGTAMMGVRVGEGYDPAQNAFLQVQAIKDGTMHAGYAVSTGRIVVGLPPELLKQAEFLASPVACLTIGKRETCSSLLMDTGLGYMIVPMPGLKAAKWVRAGTPATVEIRDGQRPFYAYRVKALDSATALRNHDLVPGQVGIHLLAAPVGATTLPPLNASRYLVSQAAYVVDAANVAQPRVGLMHAPVTTAAK